jgi:hypothetical protein
MTPLHIADAVLVYIAAGMIFAGFMVYTRPGWEYASRWFGAGENDKETIFATIMFLWFPLLIVAMLRHL